MNKRKIILGISAAVFLASAILLTVIAEKPISSMSVTVPAILIIFCALLLGQKTAGLKTAECFLPAACGLLLSAEYVFLEYRIYDTALAEIYPFSNVIKGQYFTILLCAVLSAALLFTKFLSAKKIKQQLKNTQDIILVFQLDFSFFSQKQHKHTLLY